MSDKKQLPRGVFIKRNAYWIRYVDATKKYRREKVGPLTRTMLRIATELVEKRRTEARLQIKMPERFRAKPFTFDEAAKLARFGPKDYKATIVCEEFGDRSLDSISVEDINRWLDSHESWQVSTRNRYLAVLKKVFRLAEESGKVTKNPARLIRMKQENNARVRYLNQHRPAKTKLDWLKPHEDEESRLRAVIARDYSRHLPEFEVALNTGLRRGEQYGLTWDCVNFERKLLTIPRSKNGRTRHVPLNSVAVAMFKSLLSGMERSNRVFLPTKGKRALQSNRHWFSKACELAGVADFTWHDLRHTFASRLVMAGVDIRTVQELLGHSSINVTVRYSHLAPDHQLAAVERLVTVAKVVA